MRISAHVEYLNPSPEYVLVPIDTLLYADINTRSVTHTFYLSELSLNISSQLHIYTHSVSSLLQTIISLHIRLRSSTPYCIILSNDH